MNMTAIDLSLKTWRLPLAITGVAVAVQVLHLQTLLQYQRDLVSHGEIWRLLTATFVHMSWLHLVRDVAGLFLVWLYFDGYQSERAWLALCLACSLAAIVGLYVLSPQVHWYVGLSGMEYGLFGAGAVLEWMRTRWLGIVMLALVWAVVLYGLLVGPLPGEALGLGAGIVPQAHLYGLICGIVFVCFQHVRSPRSVAHQ